jgi:hypothetical protein
VTYPMGQTLLAVHPGHRRADQPRLQLIDVVKLGKRWAYFVDHAKPNYKHLAGRFDLEDQRWPIDGGQYTSPGRVYRDRDDYELQKRLDEEWDDLRPRLPHRRPLYAMEPEVAQLRRLVELGKRDSI